MTKKNQNQTMSVSNEAYYDSFNNFAPVVSKEPVLVRQIN